MTRKKVKLSFITNDSTRKATYKKRKKGLMKKVHELSTLCGINAIAIIYSPYEAQPEIWPNNVGVRFVLGQFKRIPEMERSKNMLDNENFFRNQITKTNKQVKKQMKENREKEMTEFMYQCLTGKGSLVNLNLPDLTDLDGLVDRNLKDISKRIASLEIAVPGKSIASPPSLPPQPQATVGGSSSHTIDDMKNKGVVMHAMEKQPMVVDNVSGMDGMQRTRWFTDWMNNPSEHNLGLAPPYEMMAPFANNPNPLWPNPHFP